MIWVDTKTDEDARRIDREMWDLTSRAAPDGTLVTSASGPSLENGEFWSIALNRIKEDPGKRYEMARRHLPLPAAWREMAIALRMMIRKARREKQPFERELRELHHLAAMSSYADYGCIERVPYARIASLDLSFERIGCDQLPLLGNTDCKWMKACWGNPISHSTAAELYADARAIDVLRIKTEREEERRDFKVDFLADWETHTKEPTDPPIRPVDQQKGWRVLAWLFGR